MADLMTKADAARMLGVTPGRVSQLVAAGRLRTRKVRVSVERVLCKDVDSIIDGRKERDGHSN